MYSALLKFLPLPASGLVFFGDDFGLAGLAPSEGPEEAFAAAFSFLLFAFFCCAASLSSSSPPSSSHFFLSLSYLSLSAFAFSFHSSLSSISFQRPPAISAIPAPGLDFEISSRLACIQSMYKDMAFFGSPGSLVFFLDLDLFSPPPPPAARFAALFSEAAFFSAFRLRFSSFFRSTSEPDPDTSESSDEVVSGSESYSSRAESASSASGLKSSSSDDMEEPDWSASFFISSR